MAKKKEQSKTFSIRLESSLMEKLRKMADEESRTVNNLVSLLLTKQLTKGNK